MSEYPREFNPEELTFSFNLKDAFFEIDSLQNALLQDYLRFDPRFRRAFNRNFTGEFLEFIRSKIKLREPYHISTRGTIRGGKSTSMISVCCIHMAYLGKVFSVKYICANAMEFLEKLRTMSENDLIDSIFLIDEEKSMFGIGSLGKKAKLVDVQNIIAKNNISTIMINPTSWQNSDAFYGLRAFGRDLKLGVNRFMLYNLQESSGIGSLPLGNIYLPIFEKLLPKEYGEKLKKDYLAKKDSWIELEMRGNNDTLAVLRKKSAENFMRDKSYLELKKKNEKISYIQFRMGSEWTRSEILDIYELTQLLEKGILGNEE